MNELIRKQDALNTLYGIGGCGAKDGTWESGWDGAIATADREIRSIPDVTPEEWKTENIERQRWETDVMKRAIQVFGVGHQQWKLIEEMGEMLTAFARLQQTKSDKDYENLVEEMADVGIMMDEVKLMHANAAEIENARAGKMVRLGETVERHERMD